MTISGKTAPRISDGNSPWNEAFTFTHEQYALLRKIRPDLFDADPATRTRRWKEFANTSEGRAFRWR